MDSEIADRINAHSNRSAIYHSGIIDYNGFARREDPEDARYVTEWEGKDGHSTTEDDA